MKEHLLHFFPFLHKEFRKLKESELQNKETFKEFFPNEPVELWKLRTIYVFQNLENELKVFVTSSEKQPVQRLDRKTIKNAEV